MIRQFGQLILHFEPSLEPQRDRTKANARLRMYHNENEYFDSLPVPEFDVQLPGPFQATVLSDPAGWRKKQRRSFEAQELGSRMWASLPDTVRNEILSGDSAAPKRVAIFSGSCGFDDVPWEWLSDKPSNPIAAMDSVRFVRLVPTLYATPPITATPKVRVLIVLTNPKDESFLDGSREIFTIDRGLTNHQSFESKISVEPKLDALKKDLEWLPHIVHYVGHSGVTGETGNLILHDNQNGTQWLPPEQIRRILPSSVRLLCLSTCVTAENYDVRGLVKFAHCPPEISLPTVILNQYALDQPQAQAFWTHFYPALLTHKGNVVDAFHESRIAARNADPNSSGWASFSLVVRDGIGQSLRIPEVTRGPAQPEDRFASEVRAQWSSRLANKLANRMRSVSPEAKESWQKSINDESARLQRIEDKIDKK